jgi:Matrixin
LGAGAGEITRQAAVNSIHYLGLRDGKPDLVRLRLPGIEDKPATAATQPAPAPGPPAPPPQKAPGVYKIPVAILVDTADLRARAVWEKKLRKRVADASDIFEHHCRVRFEVLSVGTWQSNPAIHSFDDALTDFAQKVRPAPARVAIGFTSRYDWQQDESHLGGTQGSLASHVLIREGVRVSEPERLEVLVHELGHFLGAAHTSDQSSVMRPKLGDRRSTAKSFRIGFDAPNTLVINLIAEEMRTRHIWHASLLSPEAKTAVRGAYMALAKSIPSDPVATSSIESLGPVPQAPGPPSIASPELVNGARFVVKSLAQAARENTHLPVTSKDSKQQLWRTGDELMSYYVRRAAAAARQLRPEMAPSAFLLGLGVALDESNYVHDKTALNDVWQKIEPDDQRHARILIMGSPTIRKRHDVVGHFTMSAALVVLTGPQGAEAAGLGKEILDSRSGNGFSFVDLCADMSGVVFATHVREDNIPLEQVVKSFAVENFVPSLDDLPEDISWDKFQKEYGEGASENFQRQRGEIYHRVLALPPYRAPEAKKKTVAGAANNAPAAQR